MSFIIPEHAWIALVDGHEARIYQNVGRDSALELRELQHLTPHTLHAESPGGNRPIGDTPRDTAEAAFAKEFAHWLYLQAHKNAYQSLVLSADAKTLGQLRPQLHKEVQERLIKEMHKDLVKAPMDEVLRSLKAA